MKILALDTSGQHASAAIVVSSTETVCRIGSEFASTKKDSGRANPATTKNISTHVIIGEVSLNARHGEKAYTHSEILMPAVEKLFELTGQKTEELDSIAYTCGPGSFTGIRIGASTALGLAKALNIQAVAVPTLDALAYNAYGMGFGGDICPMMDARRGQVYFALFDSGFNKIIDYKAKSIDEVLSSLRGETLIIGDGAEVMHSRYSSSVNENEKKRLVFAAAHHNFVRASSVGLRACNNLNSYGGKMIYVRPPQAVREMTGGI